MARHVGELLVVVHRQNLQIHVVDEGSARGKERKRWEERRRLLIKNPSTAREKGCEGKSFNLSISIYASISQTYETRDYRETIPLVIDF